MYINQQNSLSDLGIRFPRWRRSFRRPGRMAPVPRFSRLLARKLRALTIKTKKIPKRLQPARKAPGRKKFLQWLKSVDPSLYQKVMLRVDASQAGRGISGMSLEGFGGLWDDIKGTVNDVLSTGLQLKQQRDLYKLQLARAEKGLPPLNADQVAPTIKTQVEIGPETRGQLFDEIGAGLKRYALPLAVGAGALFVLSRRK